MKLTKDMKYRRLSFFKECRTNQKVKPISQLINFTYEDSVHLKRTDTLMELVTQIDLITEGQEYEVQWYTLDNNHIQLYIKHNNLNYSLYCKEILQILENFLHVECQLVEKTVTEPATIKTTKSIICTKGA